MRITIKTIDGQLHRSDPKTREEVMASEDWTEAQYDDQINGLERIFKNLGSASFVSLEIGGKVRYFNPTNIVWAEIDRKD